MAAPRSSSIDIGPRRRRTHVVGLRVIFYLTFMKRKIVNCECVPTPSDHRQNQQHDATLAAGEYVRLTFATRSMMLPDIPMQPTCQLDEHLTRLLIGSCYPA